MPQMHELRTMQLMPTTYYVFSFKKEYRPPSAHTFQDFFLAGMLVQHRNYHNLEF